MKALSFIAPPDAGTARIKVIGPDGPLHLHRPDEGAPIVTPSGRELRIASAPNGAYTAIIEPLGGEPLNYLFMVDDQTHEIRIPSLDELADLRVPKDWLSSGRARRSPAGDEATFASKSDLLDLSTQYKPDQSSSAKAFSIGLSTDARPMHYGGWRPFRGTWPHQLHPVQLPSEGSTSDEWHGGVALDIIRTHEPLGRHAPGSAALPRRRDEARLRFSLSLAGTRVQRLLVPLFSGGVRIRMSHADPDDITLDVLPIDSEKASLTQALVSAFDSEASAIWSDFQKTNPIDGYISADMAEDPWIVVVAGLLVLRFGTIENECPWWVDALESRYPWIPDVHVLKARCVLLSAGEADASRVAAADEALSSLYRARRLGAPYFAQANELLGESLAALADAAPEERQRARASDEIVRWRRHLPHQRTAGASFSWVMSNGHRSGGGLDSRYSTIVGTGLVAERGIQLLPDS